MLDIYYWSGKSFGQHYSFLNAEALSSSAWHWPSALSEVYSFTTKLTAAIIAIPEVNYNPEVIVDPGGQSWNAEVTCQIIRLVCVYRTLVL